MTPRMALAAIAIAAAVLLVAWVGRVSEGRRALAECDGAIARGDVFDAVLAGRAAAEARCPGCASPERGFARLERIAKDAETRGDDATALAAWRAARSAGLSTGERRDRADVEIARLGHRLDVTAVAAGAPPTAAASEDRLRAALATDDRPSTTTFALLAAGGALFFWAAGRLVRGSGPRAPDLGLAAAGAGLAAAGALFF